MIAAIILSAGLSSRMGYPKALLEYRGKTFLQSILDAVQAAGIKRRLVVVGPHADKLLAKHDLHDICVVATKQFDAGPIGSIRTAIRALEAHPVDGMLVWPVDIPHVTITTVEALLDGFRDSGHSIVLPVFEGRRGHPVVFGRAVFDELLSAPESEGAGAVVRADPDRVLHVEVSDPAVLEDLNTPLEYHSLMRKEDQSR